MSFLLPDQRLPTLGEAVADISDFGTVLQPSLSTVFCPAFQGNIVILLPLSAHDHRGSIFFFSGRSVETLSALLSHITSFYRYPVKPTTAISTALVHNLHWTDYDDKIGRPHASFLGQNLTIKGFKDLPKRANFYRLVVE